MGGYFAKISRLAEKRVQDAVAGGKHGNAAERGRLRNCSTDSPLFYFTPPGEPWEVRLRTIPAQGCGKAFADVHRITQGIEPGSRGDKSFQEPGLNNRGYPFDANHSVTNASPPTRKSGGSRYERFGRNIFGREKRVPYPRFSGHGTRYFGRRFRRCRAPVHGASRRTLL